MSAEMNLSRILSYSCGLEVLLQPPIRIVEKDWLVTLGLQEEVSRIVQAFEDRELDDTSAKAKLRSVVLRLRQRWARYSSAPFLPRPEHLHR